MRVLADTSIWVNAAPGRWGIRSRLCLEASADYLRVYGAAEVTTKLNET